MRVALKFRQRIVLLGQFLVDELDQLLATITGTWDMEHQDDGSHGNVTALTLTATAPTTAATVLGSFKNPNGQVGRIVTTGTGTAYLTTSDSQLKESKGEAKSIDILKNTLIHDFVWKADGRAGRGVMAQEAVLVLPEAVFPEQIRTVAPGRQEVDPWAVNYPRYIPELIVGWQQHHAEVEALKERLSVLEQGLLGRSNVE